MLHEAYTQAKARLLPISSLDQLYTAAGDVIDLITDS